MSKKIYLSVLLFTVNTFSFLEDLQNNFITINQCFDNVVFSGQMSIQFDLLSEAKNFKTIDFICLDIEQNIQRLICRMAELRKNFDWINQAYEGHKDFFLKIMGSKLNVFDKKLLGRYLLRGVLINEDLVKILVYAGAEVNMTNDCGCTPLLEAIEHSQFATAKFLIYHGANLNSQDLLGNTALIKIVLQIAYRCLNESGNKRVISASEKDIITELIKLGADPNIEDLKEHKTVLDYAKMGGPKFQEISQILRKSGAKESPKLLEKVNKEDRNERAVRRSATL